MSYYNCTNVVVGVPRCSSSLYCIYMYVRTCAYNPSIFCVSTVVVPPAIMEALRHTLFISSALNIIQPDGVHTLAKLRSGRLPYGHRKAKLSAYDYCIIHVPGVVTDCAPLSVVQHFNTALCLIIDTTSNQPQLHIWNLRYDEPREWKELNTLTL